MHYGSGIHRSVCSLLRIGPVVARTCIPANRHSIDIFALCNWNKRSFVFIDTCEKVPVAASCPLPASSFTQNISCMLTRTRLRAILLSLDKSKSQSHVLLQWPVVNWLSYVDVYFSPCEPLGARWWWWGPGWSTHPRTYGWLRWSGGLMRPEVETTVTDFGCSLHARFVSYLF